MPCATVAADRCDWGGGSPPMPCRRAVVRGCPLGRPHYGHALCDRRSPPMLCGRTQSADTRWEESNVPIARWDGGNSRCTVRSPQSADAVRSGYRSASRWDDSSSRHPAERCNPLTPGGRSSTCDCAWDGGSPPMPCGPPQTADARWQEFNVPITRWGRGGSRCPVRRAESGDALRNGYLLPLPAGTAPVPDILRTAAARRKPVAGLNFSIALGTAAARPYPMGLR